MNSHNPTVVFEAISLAEQQSGAVTLHVSLLQSRCCRHVARNPLNPHGQPDRGEKWQRSWVPVAWVRPCFDMTSKIGTQDTATARWGQYSVIIRAHATHRLPTIRPDLARKQE